MIKKRRMKRVKHIACRGAGRTLKTTGKTWAAKMLGGPTCQWRRKKKRTR